MTSNPFRSSWKKLERADFHVQELSRAIDEAWNPTGPKRQAPFAYNQVYLPKRHCILVFVAEVQPAPEEWGVILGDILHNLHSALDNIAWTLVCHGTSPPSTLSEEEQGRIYFPLFKGSDGKAMTRFIREKLPGVDRHQRAIVRKCQPGALGKRKARNHSLAVLNRLSNHDKHRIVQPLFYRAREAEIVVGEPRDFTITRRALSRVAVIEQGTEILRLYGRRTGPDPYCEVKVRSFVEPALEEGYLLRDSLELIAKRIVALIRELEPRIG